MKIGEEEEERGENEKWKYRIRKKAKEKMAWSNMAMVMCINRVTEYEKGKETQKKGKGFPF